MSPDQLVGWLPGVSPTGENVKIRFLPPDRVRILGPRVKDEPQRGTVGELGGEYGVEPVGGEVEGLGPRPAEAGDGGVVVGAVLQQEVACGAQLLGR